MAIKLPLVVANGQIEQLQAGDSITSGLSIGSYSPGSFSIGDDQYLVMSKRLTLTTTQRATLTGTARLRIT